MVWLRCLVTEACVLPEMKRSAIRSIVEIVEAGFGASCYQGECCGCLQLPGSSPFRLISKDMEHWRHTSQEPLQKLRSAVFQELCATWLLELSQLVVHKSIGLRWESWEIMGNHGKSWEIMGNHSKRGLSSWNPPSISGIQIYTKLFQAG